MLKLLIFMILIQIATSRLQNEYEIISRLIGKQRVNQHFSDNLQFLEAVKYESNKISSTSINNIKTLKNSPYIVCSEHKSGQIALKALQFDLGESNAHVLYSSKHDSTCFIVKIDNIIKDDSVNIKDMMTKISKNNNIQFNMIMPMPMSLKLHQSSIMILHSIHSSSFYDINDKDHVLKRRMLNLLNDPMKIKDFEINIDFGLGVYNKSNKNNNNLKDIEMVLSNHNINGLENIVESTKTVLSSKSILSDKMTSNIWKESHYILSNQNNICDYSKLSIVNKNEIKLLENVNSITISGLSSLLKSKEKKYFIHNMNNNNDNDINNACLASLFANFANHPSIINVAIKPKMRVFNNNAKSIIQNNSIDTMHTPYTNIGLNGSDQIIGVGDSGLDDYGCFFSNDDGSVVKRSSFLNPTYDKTKRKVIQYVAYMNGIEEKAQGHGTHVSGTIAGDISSYTNEYRGHAPGSKLAFFDMSDDGNSIGYPLPFSDYVLSTIRKTGSKIFSGSWGSDYNMYSSIEVDIDNYLYENDKFITVFANGNSGSNGYFSVGSPAISKNTISVAASESAHSSDSFKDYLSFFSSLGPTFDYRYKPDIAAPGFTTKSASSSGTTSTSCTVVGMSGTSMATPAVAANAALIRQYFEDNSFWSTQCNQLYDLCQSGSFSPRGATIKAMIIHSGNELQKYDTTNRNTEVPGFSLTSPVPDYLQGYGKMLLKNILPYTSITPIDMDLYIYEGKMSSLTYLSYSVNIPASYVFNVLKLTIVWMDPPNTVLSAKMLLNDLDIRVIDPSGQVYFGNGENGDDINNVEQIYILNPIKGVYTVEVLSHTLQSEDEFQKFTLVITSPGYVVLDTPTLQDLESINDLNTLNCHDDETEIWITKTDHGGNGWGSGNKFKIEQKYNSSFSIIDTLDSSYKVKFYQKSGYCLQKNKTYSIELISTSENNNPSEMGLHIPSCDLFLDQYTTNDEFFINSYGQCNFCNNTLVSLFLWGPLWGTTYGWKDSTSYYIEHNSSIISIGTLNMGVMSIQKYCFPKGDYKIGFLTLADDDDYLFGDLGVTQYSISVDVCGNTLVDLYGWKCNSNDQCYKLMEYSTVEIDGKTDCPINYTNEPEPLNLEFLKDVLLFIILIIFLYLIWYNMLYLKERVSKFMNCGKYGIVENEIELVPTEFIKKQSNNKNITDSHQPNITKLYENITMVGDLEEVNKESNIEFYENNNFRDELNK